MRSRRALLAAALPTVALLASLAVPLPGQAQVPGALFTLPPELVRPITFAWTGTLDGAAKALADRIGYGFSSGDALGGPVPPGKPPIEVSVSVANTSPAEVAQLLSNQVRGRAVVVVNPTTRTIEVYRYG